MRIISGRFKGRRFNPPLKKCHTRPTMDMAKEGLFNILANQIDIEDISVLDLFGGTGSICLEFVSRGCSNITYVDKSYHCVRFFNDIKQHLSLHQELKIIRSDVLMFLDKNINKFDLIFADPPYDYRFTEELIKKIFEKKILKENGTFILEHDKRHDFSKIPNFLNSRKYGTNIFSWFEY
jgi:16S rRNA (guanine(966)-N(2))-methyltransferase RsmD